MPVRNKLPRSLSLKKKADIDQLLASGEKLSGDCFLLFWDQAESFAYAVLVARKLGSAVARNRIKRKFREAIRMNRNKITFPVHTAILPHKTATEMKFSQINAEISRIFERINRRV